MAYQKMPKNAKEFYCQSCDFICFKKSNFETHLATPKHKRLTEDLQKSPKKCQKMPDQYSCICGKTYKHRQSLHKHRMTCSIISAEIEREIEQELEQENTPQAVPVQNSGISHDDLMLAVTKTIEGLNPVLIEAIKNAGNHNSHNTTNNTNNTFNLQFYLNETCKNALNIQDFVKNLQISTQDFEEVGKLGYAEGISRLVINGLNEMDVTERPIQCSDLKREVIHIKDDDKWEKDTPNQDKLKGVIKQIENRNLMVMDDWTRANPGCKDPNHGKNDLYLNCIQASCGPVDASEEAKSLKMISKNLANHTVIKKMVE